MSEIRIEGDVGRFLAAIAAAVLGAQGSAVWAQTAEALLLEDADVRREYGVAARQVEAALSE